MVATNRRERIQREPTSGSAQLTVYDEAGQWLGNYSSNGEALQQVIWLENYPVVLMNAPAAGVPGGVDRACKTARKLLTDGRFKK